MGRIFGFPSALLSDRAWPTGWCKTPGCGRNSTPSAQNRHPHKDDEAPAAKIQKTDEVFGTAGLVARAIVTARALWVKT
jgi:hypothetical protein